MVIDALRKFFYAGIGVLAISETKTKEMLDELVKQGEISGQEAEKLFSEVRDKCAKAGKSVEDKFMAGVHDVLKISDLEKRIGALESELEKMKARLG